MISVRCLIFLNCSASYIASLPLVSVTLIDRGEHNTRPPTQTTCPVVFSWTPDHRWLCHQDLFLKSPLIGVSVAPLSRLKTDFYGKLKNEFSPGTIMNSVWTHGSQSRSMKHSQRGGDFVIIEEITAHQT